MRSFTFIFHVVVVVVCDFVIFIAVYNFMTESAINTFIATNEFILPSSPTSAFLH